MKNIKKLLLSALLIASIASAADQAAQTVGKTLQKAPPEPKPMVSKYNLHIKAFETEGGKQVEANHHIFRPIDEDDSKNIFRCKSYKEKACKKRLPVGEYYVVSTYNHQQVKTSFTITAEEKTKLNIIVGETGKVKIIALETEGGKQVKADHHIFSSINEDDEDDGKYIVSCKSYKEKACKRRIHVGEYFLISKYNQFKIKTPFTVTAGQTTNLNVIMGQTGKVNITAFETEGGKQVEASHSIYPSIDEDEDEDKYIISCKSDKEKTCKKRIPVGEYFLISKYNHFEIKTPFTVSAGQTTDLNVITGQTGKVKIKAFETEGGKQVEASHSIYPSIDEDDEDDDKYIVSCKSGKEKTCKKRIPVGEYFLISKYSHFEIKTPFTVTAGQTTDLNVIMGQTGEVQIKAFETEGGKQVEASHSIHQPIDEDKRIVSCSSKKTESCTKRIPVGEYLLISRYNRFKVKTPFTVTADHTTNLNVIMGQTGEIKIITFETEGGKPVEASHNIHPSTNEDDSKYIVGCISYKEKACKMRIPVGEYFLISEYNHFEIKTPFKVTAGQTTDLNVITGQTGEVRIAAFETEGGKPVRASHSIHQPIDKDKRIERCNSKKTEPCIKRIPVGEYFLISEYNHFKIKTPFTVMAGQTNDLNVIMGQTGKVQIAAFETEGGKQVRAFHTIYQPIDEDEKEQIVSCSSEKIEPCIERIPVGEYFLISRYSRFIIKTPFTVTAGQTMNVSVITGQTGKVEIAAFATMGGKRVRAHHGIYQPIDEDESKRIETCISKKTKPCKKRLPVGKYFVKSSYGDIKLETPLTITAGQTTRLTIDFSRTPKPVDKKALIEAGKEASQNIQPTNMAPDTPAASANTAPVIAPASQ